ncbi:hypothetical protein JY651_14660 [Pyxidicoccus parkwayensis]|uniref:Uncharacterized protein n=1 Tax=Pyxidicoccus parkwayensis TaxID=2813578 RepID=A0ABX7P6M0_9BACT|nr:hypothetical protein [Pyxidicoccus parkwaysis]QSQ26086.1 hypothetical protein JY651_14660 [Pyxidicoccus parkwaysis]
MRHSVLITAAEASLLAQLHGQQLHALWADPISAALWAGDHVLAINAEEIATPFPSHPLADVTRPHVVDITAKPQPQAAPLAFGDLGRIERVSLLTTWVSFTPVRPAPELRTPEGIVIPAGNEWSVLTRSPTGLTDEDTGVLLDVAIQLELASGKRIALSTDTIGTWMKTCIDTPLPDDLDACSLRTELSQRLG